MPSFGIGVKWMLISVSKLRMTVTVTECLLKGNDISFLKFRMTFTLAKYVEKSSSMLISFLKFRMTFTLTKYFSKGMTSLF